MPTPKGRVEPGVSQSVGPERARAVRAGIRSAQAVAWAFLGVRAREGARQDTTVVNPFVVIGFGIVFALVFVGALIGLVRWVA